MEPRDTRRHWRRVWATRDPTETSWYQAEPRLALDRIEAELSDREAPILDVGGGASTLVDGLLGLGYRNLTVLDLAAEPLAAARRRLGGRAGRVRWLVADVLEAPIAVGRVALWHDRAVFHFFTAAADRARYAERAARALAPGGRLLLAAFAADGPSRCSGLEVRRYSAEALASELGPRFAPVDAWVEEHRTPAGAPQPFQAALFRRVAGG